MGTIDFTVKTVKKIPSVLAAVILIGLTSQWGHVIAGGQMGFIYAKYLK
jgi:hypothetical protein